MGWIGFFIVNKENRFVEMKEEKRRGLDKIPHKAKKLEMERQRV
jgi:hypothetical protein